MLGLQHRILAALDTDRPDRIDVLGHETLARHYFVDLQMLAYLIRVSWPHGRDLVPTRDLGDALDMHLSDLTGQHESTAHYATSRGRSQGIQHRHKSPPLDAVACATLLATADSLLTLSSPPELSTELRRLLAHDDRRPGRAAWSRTFLEDRPDCSPGMRLAVAPSCRPTPAPDDPAD